MKLLIVGATGLVGRHVLELALANPCIETVVAPVRREFPAYPFLAGHANFSAPYIDYTQLTDAPWWQADAVICTLGTTMRKAGTKDAFYQVDHDYPLAVAQLAKSHGVPAFVLNSAAGADLYSRFYYSRVKGALEADLQNIGFSSLTLVRPGLIGGNRDEFRLAERLSGWFLRLVGPLLPRRMRINPAKQIAKALLEAALEPQPGLRVIPAADLI